MEHFFKKKVISKIMNTDNIDGKLMSVYLFVPSIYRITRERLCHALTTFGRSHSTRWVTFFLFMPSARHYTSSMNFSTC